MWRNGRAYVLLEQGTPSDGLGASKKVANKAGEVETNVDPLDGDPEWEVEVEEKNEELPPEHYARQALSRDELAMALRPIIGDAEGRTYVAVEPAYDIADAALAMSPDEELVVEGQSFEPPEKKAQLIFGGDDRVVAPNSNPYRWMVHFSNNCSGVFIGWHTIITAAHCVYNPVTNAHKTPFTLTVFKQGSSSTGLGQIYIPNAGVGNGIAVPSGFDNDTESGDKAWDFAVIDLTGYAVSPTGWNGYSVNYGGSSMKMYGWPRSGTGDNIVLCPGKTTNGWLCGMSGAGEVSDYRLESWEIDASRGQSGGPWLKSTNHTIGVHTGWREYVDIFKCGFICRRNYGRRLDSTFFSYIQANSADL